MRKSMLVCCVLLITKISWCQVVYTFNGNGKWSDSSNWVNKLVPPVLLDSGSQIIIDPIVNGECLLDTLQFLRKGANITVQTGKKLNMSQKLVVNPEETGLGCSPSNLDSFLALPILDTNELPLFNSKKNPSSFELSMPTEIGLPTIQSQGSQGACTAFATAYAARSYYLHKDHCGSYLINNDLDYSKVLSPAFVYNLGKDVGSTCNEGESLLKAFSVMHFLGVSTWEKMPYISSNCSKFPDNSVLKNASIYKIDGVERVTDISVPYVKRVLMSGNLLIGSFQLDYGFWKYGFFIWEKQIGEKITTSNHAMVICGFNDNLHAFKVMNSYGVGWGFSGYGWIDYDYLNEVVNYKTSRLGDIGDWEMFVMKTSPRFAVDLKINTSTITTGNAVTFSDATEPKPTSVEWSFPGGDPSSSTELAPKVTYNTPGNYTVTLTTKACSSFTQKKDSNIIVSDAFTDPRDGQVYTYKQFGTQIWMTMNLNYAAPGSLCFYDDPINCAYYGHLYNWNTALTVAPPGWHLPSDEEWVTLTNFLGGDAVAGGAMQDPSIGWNAQFGGLFNGDLQYLNGSLDNDGFWWSSTEIDAIIASYRSLYRGEQSFLPSSVGPSAKIEGMSVRCIKD